MTAIEIYRKEKRDKPGGFDMALQIVLDRTGTSGIKSLLDLMLTDDSQFSSREVDRCMSFYRCIEAITEKYDLVEKTSPAPKSPNYPLGKQIEFPEP